MSNKSTYLRLNRQAVILFFVSLFIGQAWAQGGGTESLKWWNDAVFYEVFVRSFKDSNGDGKGDINGLIEKLDYLNDGDSTTHTDLGITGIWLMPIQESPSYHGYDVTDYRKVESDYGTNNDFKRFMEEAHKRGIKVIIDYVMNHSSSQHQWFKDAQSTTSDKRDWYIWNDVKPTIKGPWGQTVWHTKSNSNYYGIFWSEMPDLNYNNADVKAEMFDNAKFWLEDMNVDGFRLDAIKYIFEDDTKLEDTQSTIDFWKEFKTYYKAINTNALTVGEAWTTTDKIAPYMDGNGLDFCFEFDLATEILNTAKTGSTTALKTQIDKVIATYPAHQFGTFLTNHDMDRVMNNLGNTERAKVAASLLLTLPGVPFIYYGEEIGMTGRKPDENIRKPLPWNGTPYAGFTSGTPWQSLNSDFQTKNIAAQQLDASSLWNNYRNLIALRNNQAALRKGTYGGVTSSTSAVIAFLRQFEEDNILVVSNAGNSNVTNVQLSDIKLNAAAGNYVLVNLLGGDEIPVTVNSIGEISGLLIANIDSKTTSIYKLLATDENTTSVTFRVNMNEIITDAAFNPLKDAVDIIATFNDFGKESITTLFDQNFDGIYEVTVSDVHIGSTIRFKYRMNASNDGREEFSTSNYLRDYLILEGGNTVTNNYEFPNLVGLHKDLNNNVSVFPIPSNNTVNIRFSDGFTGTFNYSMTDVIGIEKMSSTASASNGMYQLSCEGFPSGIYLLTIDYQQKKEAIRVLIQN